METTSLDLSKVQKYTYQPVITSYCLFTKVCGIFQQLQAFKHGNIRHDINFINSLEKKLYIHLGQKAYEKAQELACFSFPSRAPSPLAIWNNRWNFTFPVILGLML